MYSFDVEAFNVMAGALLPLEPFPFWHRDEDWGVLRAEVHGFDSENWCDGPDTVYSIPPSLFITLYNREPGAEPYFFNVHLPHEFLDVLNEENVDHFNRKSLLLYCGWDGKICLKEN